MNEIAQPSITDWITAISAIVTAVAALTSAVILLFYTIYTHKMQQAIEKQVEEQVRQTEELIHQRRLGVLPYLVASINRNGVELENIGNGTALNIEILPKIQDLDFSDSSHMSKSEKELIQELSVSDNVSYEFEKIPALPSREKRYVYFSRNSVSSNNTIQQDEIWSGIKFVGTLIFQDIESNFYKQDLSKVLDKWVRHEFPTLLTQSEVNEILAQSKNLLEKNK